MAFLEHEIARLDAAVAAARQEHAVATAATEALRDEQQRARDHAVGARARAAATRAEAESRAPAVSQAWQEDAAASDAFRAAESAVAAVDARLAQHDSETPSEPERIGDKPPSAVQRAAYQRALASWTAARDLLLQERQASVNALAVERQRLADARARRQATEAQVAALREAAAASDSEAAQADARAAQLEALIQTAAAREEQLRLAVDATRAPIADLNALRTEVDREPLDRPALERAADELGIRLDQLHRARAAAGARAAASRQRIKQLGDERRRLEDELNTARARVVELEGPAPGLDERIRTEEAALAPALQRISTLSRAIANHRARKPAV